MSEADKQKRVGVPNAEQKGTPTRTIHVRPSSTNRRAGRRRTPPGGTAAWRSVRDGTRRRPRIRPAKSGPAHAQAMALHPGMF